MQACGWCSSPHPDWQPGQSMTHPFPSSETIDLDPAELGARGMYPFVISSIVPRPIAFICSVSKQASTTEPPALLADDTGMRLVQGAPPQCFQANLIPSMHSLGKTHVVLTRGMLSHSVWHA